tara:strand:- start:934 stop:2007 length:1074 start_codon:yes stop_codon:yes gene_type:complete
MNTHADKTNENKSQAVSAVDSQIQSRGESTFQFVDNRPEAIAQRKLQEIANSSQQVSQLRAFQDMTDNKQAVQKKEKVPRRTEKGILDEMATGNGNLINANSDDLVAKMGKGQTSSKARKIAAETEAESENLVQALDGPQQTQVRAAIRDYVSSSSAIQNDARNNPNAVNQTVQALDTALQAIRQQLAANNETNERIVYRSISYPNSDDIPYGQVANGSIINVGNFVGDLGFLSTSEHRQFILGKEQTNEVKGLLKLAIHGKTGVPIAIDIPLIAYSNTNQKKLYDMQQDKSNKLKQTWDRVFGGPGAGQAEVLFPRNAVFEVKKIQRNGALVSVVLEEFTGQRPGTVLNMKYGTQI